MSGISAASCIETRISGRLHEKPISIEFLRFKTWYFKAFTQKAAKKYKDGGMKDRKEKRKKKEERKKEGNNEKKKEGKKEGNSVRKKDWKIKRKRKKE